MTNRGVTHEAYPIAPREGVPCRNCHARPATYRAVRVGKNPHAMAAKYRCLTCINDEGRYKIMGPEKSPAPPTEKRRVRQSPFEQKQERERDRWKTWVGVGVGERKGP